jgi:aryl-alcohol dehydrogenase-like predicted oxidoreductase
MKHVPLGRTGHTVPAIGFGCAGLSQSRDEAAGALAMETMQAALDRGMNFFDTADLYGVGHNEELIGRFIKTGARDRVILCTKFGSLPAGADGLPGVDNSPAHIARACDASLKRLGIDTIDLYYMHRRDPKVPIEESVGAMSRLVEAGKVRWLGLSEVSATTLRAACAVHPIAAIESEYSLWMREPEETVIPACRELGVSFVPFSPLGRAFLTGTLETEEFSASDMRSKLPRFHGEAAAHNRSLVAQLAGIAERLNATRAQLALAWLLGRSDAGLSIIPIPGTRRPKYVAENAAAATIELTPDIMAELEDLFAPDAVAGPRYHEIEAARAGL